MPNAGIGAMQQAAIDGRRRVLRRAPPSARTPPRGRARGAALWATLGFACGAIGWHAIGFWTMMTDVTRGGEAVVVLAADAGVIETSSLPSIYRVDPASCTSLELDRNVNRTVVRPCPPDGLALRLDTGNAREDLVAEAR
jgi:hypothetical protein